MSDALGTRATRSASTVSRYRRRGWWLVAAAGLTAASWGIGVDLPRALLLSACVAAVALLTGWLPFAARSPWPVLPYGRRDGARRDVSSLTWMLASRGHLSTTGADRLHRTLAGVLELTEHQRRRTAEDIFGPKIAQWLSAPEQVPPPTRTAAENAMVAAEALLHPTPKETR